MCSVFTVVQYMTLTVKKALNCTTNKEINKSWGSTSPHNDRILPIAKGFVPGQPARTAQADLNRNCSQMHQAPFSQIMPHTFFFIAHMSLFDSTR